MWQLLVSKAPHTRVRVATAIIAVVLISTAAFDVFHTLFHPAGRGSLSNALSRLIWAAFRALAKRKRRIITFAGPIIVVAILLDWVALTVLGFAFLYWPYLKTQFVVAPGMELAKHTGLADAVNVSIGSLITLMGDFNAKSKLIRLFMGLEAIAGFGLLTASMSWLLSLYPVLEHRRSFAHAITLLHNAELETQADVTKISESDLQSILDGFTASMSTIRNEGAQFPVAYYFHLNDDRTSMPGAAVYVLDLARECSEKGKSPGVRLAATMLGGAVGDFAETINDLYLGTKSNEPEKILQAYAEDHLQELIRHEIDHPKAA